MDDRKVTSLPVAQSADNLDDKVTSLAGLNTKLNTVIVLVRTLANSVNKLDAQQRALSDKLDRATLGRTPLYSARPKTFALLVTCALVAAMSLAALAFKPSTPQPRERVAQVGK